MQEKDVFSDVCLHPQTPIYLPIPAILQLINLTRIAAKDLKPPLAPRHEHVLEQLAHYNKVKALLHDSHIAKSRKRIWIAKKGKMGERVRLHMAANNEPCKDEIRGLRG